MVNHALLPSTVVVEEEEGRSVVGGGGVEGIDTTGGGGGGGGGRFLISAMVVSAWCNLVSNATTAAACSVLTLIAVILSFFRSTSHCCSFCVNCSSCLCFFVLNAVMVVDCFSLARSCVDWIDMKIDRCRQKNKATRTPNPVPPQNSRTEGRTTVCFDVLRFEERGICVALAMWRGDDGDAMIFDFL